MAVVPFRHKALAVDPEMDARIRLKQAATAVHQFESISLCSSLREATEELRQNGRPYDVIFISERLPREEAVGFMKETREQTTSQDAAFIILLSATDNESAKAAQTVLSGFDGCLMEPYSVDSLLEITELAARVKKERGDARARVAIQFLLKDVIRQVDKVAYIRSCRMEGGASLKRLKEACGVLETFDEDRLRVYLDSALELFQNAMPGAGVGEKTAYHGVSSRIRQRMVKRLLDQEEKATGKKDER